MLVTFVRLSFHKFTEKFYLPFYKNIKGKKKEEINDDRRTSLFYRFFRLCLSRNFFATTLQSGQRKTGEDRLCNDLAYNKSCPCLTPYNACIVNDNVVKSSNSLCDDVMV